MIKKIGILGSTGSIGKSTLNIIKKNKKNFNIIFLSSNKNYKLLSKQAKTFKPKNLIINDSSGFDYLKKKFKNKIKVFNNFNDFFSSNKIKIDFSMCSISGLEGLEPTLSVIEISKYVGIANKESIICGWYLIKKKLKKFKTEFIPIDSEHFSIWSLTKNIPNNQIEEIIITASGGPFLNFPINKLKNISPKKAINHPRWKMGKKISIDSATLMNKVFEVIEALKIFNFDLNKYKILIHPNSYVHSIVKFTNGISKILVHDTNMIIPIFNAIYPKGNKKIISNKININFLNALNFSEINKKKFPSIKILNKITTYDSLFETVLVSANDELVNLFLNKKIKFNSIIINLNKILKSKSFIKYKKIRPESVRQILHLSELVRLKTRALCI